MCTCKATVCRGPESFLSRWRCSRSVDTSGMEADATDLLNDNEETYIDEEIEEVLDDKPQRVIQGLYIGSAWAEMNKAALEKAGITDILQVALGLFPRHPLLFTYFCLQVEDAPHTDLVRYFPKCFDFIDKAIEQGGSVLVHCAAGVSRSATVVLGYLMSRHNYTLAAALEHLKAVRPWVAPNQGFMQQLAAYEAAKCDLSDWKPWHLVWCEQQEQMRQEEQRRVDSLAATQQQQPSLPAQQQQQQQWLQIPQPIDSISNKRQRQQQHHEQGRGGSGDCCQQQPPDHGGSTAAADGSNGGSNDGSSNSPAVNQAGPLPFREGVGRSSSNKRQQQAPISRSSFRVARVYDVTESPFAQVTGS